MEAPELCDFINFATGSIDVCQYYIAEEEYEDNQRNQIAAVVVQKRPFKNRKTYNRRDPKSSFWWQDYVVDAEKTWRDPLHMNGKLFRFRFSHSFDSVHEIVNRPSVGYNFSRYFLFDNISEF